MALLRCFGCRFIGKNTLWYKHELVFFFFKHELVCMACVLEVQWVVFTLTNLKGKKSSFMFFLHHNKTLNDNQVYK